MRNTASLLIILALVGLSQSGLAEDRVASFDARWPESPMPEPTTSETARFVASAVKAEVKPALKAALTGSIEEASRCRDEACDRPISR